MQVFYLLSCLTVIGVMARPEPPVFMELQQPNQKAFSLNAHIAKPHIYQQLPYEYNFGNFGALPPNYNALADSMSSDDLPPATPKIAAFEDSYNAAYRHSSNQQHQTGYEHGPTETQVHKHIYVHVPPKDFEEEDAVQPRVTHQGGRKQKHYKIVFIKAPEAPVMRAPSVPPLPQNEEKTLIYVLHKKPETHPDIVIPTPEPTKPSKPEVYFIKYKTKRDEAPVYGPPPAFNQVKPRESDKAVNIEQDDFMTMNHGQYEFEATTQHPQYQEEEQLHLQTQFANEENSNVPAELFNHPTPSNFVNERAQATTIEPISQYLPPETTIAPIVVKEMEEPAYVPASSYGTPKKNRFFIKKRK